MRTSASGCHTVFFSGVIAVANRMGSVAETRIGPIPVGRRERTQKNTKRRCSFHGI